MFQVIKTGCFVGWEGEKINFSILTNTRLSEDVVLREDCEAWEKVFTCQNIFLRGSLYLIS
jgi:hypothetical protein